MYILSFAVCSQFQYYFCLQINWKPTHFQSILLKKIYCAFFKLSSTSMKMIQPSC